MASRTNEKLCRPVPAACACLLLAAGCFMLPDRGRSPHVSVSRVEFMGWPDAVLLAKRECEVVVVPQVARIMRYAPAGGDSVLWVNPELTPQALGGREPEPDPNGWINYGGYKLWVAPQSAWGWPPHPELDRGPCRVEVLDDGAVRLVGIESAEAGVRFDRTIRLAPEGTRLDIEQVMVNTSDRQVTWAIWDVTQARAEGVTLVPLGRDASWRMLDGAEPTERWRVADGVLLTGPGGAGQKAFVSGPPGWLAAWVGGSLFVKAFDIAPQPVPEGEAPREVYASDAGFVELEIVGPEVTLKPGESATLRETWHLVKAGPLPDPDAAIARSARRLVARALMR